MELIFHCSMLCAWNCFLSLAIVRTERQVMAILPSFLLKSLQLIPLLCQGRLQVQVASIMGQLKGTVIRLNKERTQLNNEHSSRMTNTVVRTESMEEMFCLQKINNFALFCLNGKMHCVF